MKYAFIALIAFYLITYGCSPDKGEKNADSHGDATQNTLESPQQKEKAPAAVHQQEQVEQAQVEQQEAADTEHQAAVVEEPAADELAPANQWEAIANSAGVTVAALMSADSQPAEKEAVEEQQVAVIEIAEQSQPVVEEQQNVEVVDSEQVILPCGRVMARQDIPEDAPCANLKPQTVADGSQDLTAAMQKIVAATNDMVLVTRQLVIATQEMLSSSQKATVEATNTGKEVMQSQGENQPVKQ